MNKGALDLYVGIGIGAAAAEAMKSFDLTLPSGMVLVLDNCRKKARARASWLMTPSTRSPPPPAKKEHPVKDSECHHYHKTRHRRRNCPLYLAELKKNKASTSGTSELKKNKASTSGTSAAEAMESFDLTLPSRMVLVLDIDIGLRGIRKMNKGALDLYVGIGNRAAAEAMKSFDLTLPSGMDSMY
ncbi:hypothetical protein Tco_1563682 [Tanacetum coccineum]